MTKTKTNRKATNKGTCQVCGCVQKLPAGLLSKHGYTTRWGFFSGTCHGSECQPFEEDKSLIEGAIARALAQAEGIRTRQEELRQPVPAGTTKAWINVYFPAQRRGEVSHYRFVELECYAKEHALSTSPTEDRKWTGYYHVKDSDGFDCGESNRMLARYEHPKTMEEAITMANSAYAASMNKTLTEIANYVRWQRERIKDWAPKPLLPL